MMNKMTKRCVSLFLLSSLISAAAASCGNNAEIPAETAEKNTAVPVVTEAQTEAAPAEPDSLDARQLVSDNLPEADFDGKAWRVMTYNDYTLSDFQAESENGSPVNDATYRRNNTVAERFNVTYQIENGTYPGLTNTINKIISAGEDAYDLISYHTLETANLAVKGYFLDWNEIPNVNLDQPWWNQSSRENLQLGGKSFLVTGAISPFGLGCYYCIYMNKRLAAQYDIDDNIYDTVVDGKFTIDLYQELIRDKYKDLNGNGKVDDYDQFGLAAQVTAYMTPYTYSFGEMTVKHDKDGMPYLDMNVEKWADMVDKVYALVYDTEGVITTTDWSLHADTFTDGRAVFMNGQFLQSYQRFTDVKDDYAILPYPKWDEEQDRYYTMADGCCPLVCIPICNADPAFAGMITEALAAESWKTIMPVVYDLALKMRGARDERSLEVIDLIEAGCVFDFGFAFSIGETMSNMISNKNRDFASFYARNEKRWNKVLANLIAKLTE